MADLNACGAALDIIEATCPRLSNGDHLKIERSVTRGAAGQRRAAYIALRLLIERAFGSEWRGVSFALAGTGKPYLEGLAGGFSLTHVDHYALIGVSYSGPIGVDLEPVRARAVAADRRSRIEAAAQRLANDAVLPVEPEARFLQAWVRLEALAKCDGRGIGRLLTGLGIIGGQSADQNAAAAYTAAITAALTVRDVAIDPRLGIVAAVAMPAALEGQASMTDLQCLPSTADSLNAMLDLSRRLAG